MRDFLPSQVVWLIETMFSDSKRQIDKPSMPRFYLEAATAPRVAAIVEMVKAIPEHLITIESDTYILFMTSLKVLESWAAQGKNDYKLDRIPGLTDDNPLTTLLKALKECPDEYPLPEIATLRFIDDDDLRISLRLDLSATEQAINNNEWKAATVLGGSILEALLLWKLGKCDDSLLSGALEALKETSKENRLQPAKDLQHWTLEQYISVAKYLSLISDTAAKQAALAKDFRNLIHPGRSMRTKEKCGRATALTALAAVIRVVEEFSPSS